MFIKTGNFKLYNSTVSDRFVFCRYHWQMCQICTIGPRVNQQTNQQTNPQTNQPSSYPTKERPSIQRPIEPIIQPSYPSTMEGRDQPTIQHKNQTIQPYIKRTKPANHKTKEPNQPTIQPQNQTTQPYNKKNQPSQTYNKRNKRANDTKKTKPANHTKMNQSREPYHKIPNQPTIKQKNKTNKQTNKNSRQIPPTELTKLRHLSPNSHLST